MKLSRQCPKCESRQLWIIDKILERTRPDSSVLRPMPITIANFDASNGRTNSFSTLTVGCFEAWICSQCGFTEWYAKEMNGALAMLSRVADTGVTFYNGQPPQSPFR